MYTIITSKNIPYKHYKGMWKPAPKPLSKMNRNELIRNLRKFRDVWEKITTRNQDLSDDGLEETDDKGLRDLLSFYYSEDCKQLAEEWVSEEPQKRKQRTLRWKRKQRTLRRKSKRKNIRTATRRRPNKQRTKRKLKKERPSPSESATKFKVGHKKRGNDGNMWEIIQTKNKTKRWKRLV